MTKGNDLDEHAHNHDHASGHEHSHSHNNDDSLEERMGISEGGLVGKIRAVSKRYSGILKFNSALLVGDGALALYGWAAGTYTAHTLQEQERTAEEITLKAHLADFGPHAAVYAAILGAVFWKRYAQRGMKTYLWDNFILQGAHFVVDCLTYIPRGLGSYYLGFKQDQEAALVMTVSSVAGTIVHYTLMNVAAKALGYFNPELGHQLWDHSHTHSHDHTHKTPS